MVPLSQYVQEHLGQVVDVPGWPDEPECTDWSLSWFINQGGNGSQVHGNAAQWASQNWAGWVFIPNTPTNLPAPGDIIIWGAAPSLGISVDGHTAVAYRNITVSGLTSADQNWPDGSPVALVNHSYVGVLGWQHQIAPTPTPPAPPVPPVPPKRATEMLVVFDKTVVAGPFTGVRASFCSNGQTYYWIETPQQMTDILGGTGPVFNGGQPVTHWTPGVDVNDVGAFGRPLTAVTATMLALPFP